MIVISLSKATPARRERLEVGKGCLRLRPSAEIDEELVRALLEATAASREPPC